MHDNVAFGVGLLNLLRECRATTVVLTSPWPQGQRSAITEIVFANADCVVEFETKEYRGRQRQFVRATRSHDMAHQRESYELIVDHGVHIEPHGGLLRTGPSGLLRPVNVRLFLHADSPVQEEFNQSLCGAITTSLAKATVEEQILNYDPGVLKLAHSSAVDEVQIFQLDEFQIPPANQRAFENGFWPLRVRGERDGADLLSGRLETFVKRVQIAPGEFCVAVPFYENIRCWRGGLILRELCRIGPRRRDGFSSQPNAPNGKARTKTRTTCFSRVRCRTQTA